MDEVAKLVKRMMMAPSTRQASKQPATEIIKFSHEITGGFFAPRLVSHIPSVAKRLNNRIVRVIKPPKPKNFPSMYVERLSGCARVRWLDFESISLDIRLSPKKRVMTMLMICITDRL